MPLPAKANLWLIVVLSWWQDHPGFAFAVGTALVGVLYAAGILEKGDWWGNYESRW